MKNEDKKKLLLDLSCQMNWLHSRQNSKERISTPSNVKNLTKSPIGKTLMRSGIGECKVKPVNNLNNQTGITPKQLNLISLKYPVPHTKVRKI